MKFTDKKIKSLETRERRYEVYSEAERGFGIRVSEKGVKSWISRYRKNGKLVKMTLGHYPDMSLADARIKHGDLRKLLHKGIDPRERLQMARQAESEAGTVSELIHEFIERHSKIRMKSWKEDERTLIGVEGHDANKYPSVKDKWGDRKAKDITKRDVVKLLDEIVDRGSPIQANNTLARLSRMFKFGVERGLLDATPCVAISKPAPAVKRERKLDEDEIKVFWSKVDQIKTDEKIKLALKILLVTAQRRSEVGEATWKEIDMENRIWTIPGVRTKNGREHIVPLSNLAIKLLKELKKKCGESVWLLPSPHGEDDSHFTTKAITRAVSNNRDIFGLERFTPHDLRRSAASLMTKLGTPRLVVGKVLNHTDQEITAVYDVHDYLEEKRETLELLGKHITLLTKVKE